MTSVKYEKVTKSFGTVAVIKGIDLDIKDGEFVVFVGPSGCGKSTLLRMIAGLDDVSSGNLYIGTAKVNDIPAKKRNIAMVFQNYALYPHMTISENMGFGLKLRGVGKTERQKAVQEAAVILGIEDLLQRRPRALSGGQRQRVAMGRAIVRSPDVFLMDEPLSNLDAKLRTQMRVEIRTLQRRLQTTTIYVTHDQVEAMTLADRIAVLNDGYVQQFGTPSELYHSPANKFVAGFLGSPSINFISAEIIANNMLMLPNEQSIKISANHMVALSGTEKILIGIRPEDIELIEDSQPSTSDLATGDIQWRATVTLAESLGGEMLVYVKFGEQDITIKVSDRDDIVEGGKINLSFNLFRAHIFDKKTGTILSHGSAKQKLESL